MKNLYLILYNMNFFKDFIYLLLERGEGREKERERNNNVREKHWLGASHTCPDRGSNLQPRHVPWLGIELAAFYLVEQCSTNWATPFRAIIWILMHMLPHCYIGPNVYSINMYWVPSVCHTLSYFLMYPRASVTGDMKWIGVPDCENFPIKGM